MMRMVIAATTLVLATGSGAGRADDRSPPAPEVALWISSNTSGLPLDLSTDTYVSLLMDSRYSLTWSEGAPQVTDTAPAPMSTFVSAYPPGLSRERHLATYTSAREADSNQLLSDPLNLGDSVAAHFAAIASVYGGLDIDIENFGRRFLSAYAIFVRRLRGAVGPQVPISITVQISWSRDPEILALIADGTADAMNVMYYDYHAPWTAPGPVAPYDLVQANLEDLLAAGAPVAKVRMGLAAFHYDWRTDVQYPSPETTRGGPAADALGKAVRIATPAQTVTAGQVVDVTLQLTVQRTWNTTTKEIAFQYLDSAGNPRVVYSPTANSAAFKLDLAAAHGLNGVAVWNYRHLRTDPPFQDTLWQYRANGWVTADDPVPSDFLYTWSADGGTLSETVTDGTGVQWTAPSAAGSYTVTVSTSDGSRLTAESSVRFRVTP
jgi:hypothetical protein